MSMAVGNSQSPLACARQEWLELAPFWWWRTRFERIGFVDSSPIDRHHCSYHYTWASYSSASSASLAFYKHYQLFANVLDLLVLYQDLEARYQQSAWCVHLHDDFICSFRSDRTFCLVFEIGGRTRSSAIDCLTTCLIVIARRYASQYAIQIQQSYEAPARARHESVQNRSGLSGSSGSHLLSRVISFRQIAMISLLETHWMTVAITDSCRLLS